MPEQGNPPAGREGEHMDTADTAAGKLKALVGTTGLCGESSRIPEEYADVSV